MHVDCAINPIHQEPALVETRRLILKAITDCAMFKLNKWIDHSYWLTLATPTTKCTPKEEHRHQSDSEEEDEQEDMQQESHHTQEEGHALLLLLDHLKTKGNDYMHTNGLLSNLIGQKLIEADRLNTMLNSKQCPPQTKHKALRLLEKEQAELEALLQEEQQKPAGDRWQTVSAALSRTVEQLRTHSAKTAHHSTEAQDGPLHTSDDHDRTVAQHKENDCSTHATQAEQHSGDTYTDK